MKDNAPSLGIVSVGHQGQKNLNRSSNCICFGDWAVAYCPPLLNISEIDWIPLDKLLTSNERESIPSFYLSKKESGKIRFSQATPCYFWKRDLFTGLDIKHPCGWTPESPLATKDKEKISYLGVFLILKVGPPPTNFSDIKSFFESTQEFVSAKSYCKGMDIFVVSAPFSSEELHESLNSGIISNTFGTTRNIFLIDAKVSVGCEGAPIYLASDLDRQVCLGMILVTSVCFPSGKSSFTLGATLGSILPLSKESICVSSIKFGFNPADDIKKIACIRRGASYGSGCLIHQCGLVMTNHHVVENNVHDLSVYLGGEKYSATQLFSTDSNGFYDLSILKVNSSFATPLKLSTDPPVKGETVFAIGYGPTVGPEMTPHWSKGIISNLHASGGHIQTTCSVHNGSSGGAIIRPNGELLGIIYSIIGDEVDVDPNVNCAITLAPLVQMLTAYFTDFDVEHLKPLKARHKLLPVGLPKSNL